MFRSRILSAVALTAFSLSAAGAFAQTTATGKVLSDRILPQETFLYFSIPDFVRVRDMYPDSSLGRLLADPELDAFRNEVQSAFRSELDEGLAKVQDTLGMTLEELCQVPSGEMTMGISAVGNSVGLVMFFDYGDHEEFVRGLLDKATTALSEAPKLRQDDQTFDGTELTLFKVQYNGPAPTPLAEEFGWFLKDQRLVVSNQKELLEAILTNWDGQDRSFQSNESYSYIMERCQPNGGTALSRIYFDPIGLFTKLVQTGSLGQQATMGAGMALGFLPTLGLTQLKAFGAVTEAGGDDFEVVSRSVVFADQPPMGLMQVFQLDQADSVPPSWVKSDVTMFASMKWKIQEAFTAVESLVDMFAGAGALAQNLNQLADKGPGIHIKHDVIDQLDGQLRVISAPGSTQTYGGDQFLFALGLTNESSASDVLTRIASDAALQSRDFRGTKLYKCPDLSRDNRSAFCVSGGRLLIGIGTELIEQVLRDDPDATPLAESEDFRRVAQHFPNNPLTIQFSRPAEQYRSIYELLRSGTAAEQFPGMDELFERIDFTTLPPFEVIAKYVHPTGGYSVEDTNGLFTEGFQLRD